jgi:hypothetical protein
MRKTLIYLSLFFLLLAGCKPTQSPKNVANDTTPSQVVHNESNPTPKPANKDIDKVSNSTPKQPEIDIVSFINRFEEIVDLRNAIDKTVPSPVAQMEKDKEKLKQELMNKLRSGLTAQQLLDETVKKVNTGIKAYAQKKKAYIKDLNTKAAALQDDVGKLPEEHQATVKKALDDFIVLTGKEITLFDQMSQLVDNIDIFGLKSAGPKKTAVFRPERFSPEALVNADLAAPNKTCNSASAAIVNVDAAKPTDTCDCTVTTEYVNPRLIKITTTCVCKIYVQYKATFNKVIELQKKAIESFKQIKAIKDKLTSRSIEVGKANLDAYRKKLKVSDDTQTIAVGKTDVKGLKLRLFEGASPKVRKEAQLPDLDSAMPNRPIKSPAINPLFTRHAEEELINKFVAEVQTRGLKPEQVVGTLNILQSNPKGVCTTCIQGIKNPTVAPGIFKQFSLKYPNLTIKVSSLEDGSKPAGRLSFTMKNGKIID